MSCDSEKNRYLQSSNLVPLTFILFLSHLVLYVSFNQIFTELLPILALMMQQNWRRKKLGMKFLCLSAKGIALKETGDVHSGRNQDLKIEVR